MTSIPSRFLTAPGRKPRTLCGCESVAATISSIEAPSSRRSRVRTLSCLLVGLAGVGVALRVLVSSVAETGRSPDRQYQSTLSTKGVYVAPVFRQTLEVWMRVIGQRNRPVVLGQLDQSALKISDVALSEHVV